MTKPNQDLLVLMHAHFQILIMMLEKKGLVSSGDIHEALGAVRDAIPKDQFTPAVAMALNVLEAQHSVGPYQSPLPPKGDPDHKG